jgi:hypothetical protein
MRTIVSSGVLAPESSEVAPAAGAAERERATLKRRHGNMVHLKTG